MAYGILTNPVKKQEYDHLYKFKAFDDAANGAMSASTSNCANGNFVAFSKVNKDKFLTDLFLSIVFISCDNG